MALFFNGLAHFLVDAISITTLFSAGLTGETLTLALVLYNTLAFSTQCLVGLVVDKYGKAMHFNIAAMLTVILGFALPLPGLARVCIVGLGNSLFHVAGGTMTLQNSRGKAWRLGVFVAPGALGVFLGTAYPVFGWYLCAALVLCALGLAYFWPRTPMTLELRYEDLPWEKLPLAPVLLLTLAVAVRAIGGAAVSFSWKTSTLAAFALAAFVFAGKTAGGFVCDRLGAGKTALLSIPLAAVLTVCFPGNMALSLLGQFLLNLTMPVTLWLLYEALPDTPAFAFGLAASALWPGTIAGMLFRLTGPALWCCIILSFLFGLLAILYAEKAMNLKERIL